MKRTLKFIGVLVVVLVVLVMALAIAVPLLFDINDQKDRIARIVHEETGRTLTIDGDLGLTIFPWLGVTSGPMSLSQAPGSDSSTQFASFESAAVRVKLVPLVFRREVQVGRITLDGLQLRLERDANGNDNWADLVERDQRVAPEQPARTGTEQDFDLEKVDIEGFVLSNARVSFRDHKAGSSYTVEDLNVSTGALRAGAPIELTLDARVMSGVPQWRGTVAFAGRADYQAAAKSVALVIERATADMEGGALPVDRLRATLGGQVRGNLEAKTWQVNNLDLNLIVRGGRLPDRDFNARMTGGINADLHSQTATLSDFRFDGLGVRAGFHAEGSSIVDAPRFNGRVSVDAFSPRQVAVNIGQEVPDTKDPTALTHFQLASPFVATRTSIALTELDARLDASRLNGRFAVSDFERQALRFELALDQLDLDRYLPPDTPETEDVPLGALDAVRIPDALIRRLDIDGTARLAQMRAFGIASQDIRMTIKAENGLLRVNPASARLYGGEYMGDISVDVRGETPRVAIHERLAGIQAEPFFADVFESAKITGTTDMSAQLTGSGETIGAIRQTLDGRVAFSFRDGAVKGVDVWHLIRDARAVFRREERPVRPEGEPRTPFGSLVGTGVVRRGVMTNDDFRAVLPFMNVAGAGTIDLVKAEIEYRMRVTVQRTPGVEESAAEAELRGKTVPLIISGPLGEPSYRVDIAGILTEQLRDQADEARRRLEERLREELQRRIR